MKDNLLTVGIYATWGLILAFVVLLVVAHPNPGPGAPVGDPTAEPAHPISGIQAPWDKSYILRVKEGLTQ